MKIKSSLATLALLGTLTAGQLHADPQLTSWFTNYSGQYARIYTNAASETSGNAVTTWSNGTQTQSLPAYDGVQEIDSSSNWIYAHSTGLGSHVMGPWPATFPNLPTNQKTIFRFPRTPVPATSNTLTGAGAIGIFVDGVAMFNSWDANYYNGSADVSATGATGGYWNRDAYVNEGATFDPAYAHQQNGGTYHYHADPIALRYFLGDNIGYNAVSNSYSELTNVVPKHSPILAWVGDGYPLYGPYGYANPTNANSGVRRMVSGYAPRNGLNGTDNLSTNGAPRTYLPAWAIREYAVAGPQNGTTNGPAVSTTSFPFGRYMEDNAYLGDLTNPATGQLFQQGRDFDLDEYNGRFCVTPEFPKGTYAYFVSISSNGVPTYPYNIGGAYYGNNTGGSVTSITETVTTNFLGGTNSPLKLAPLTRRNSTVTLLWSAVEGGSYQVLNTSNLSTWTIIASNLSPVKIAGSYTNVTTTDKCFYRVAQTGVASFDPASGGSSGTTGGSTGILSVSPTSASGGASFTLTINLDPAANPAPPPQNAPINSITVGTIAGASNTHISQTQVTSLIKIPANATSGPVTVTVIFPGPMSNPGNIVTYTLANGFTIK